MISVPGWVIRVSETKLNNGTELMFHFKHSNQWNNCAIGIVQTIPNNGTD